LIFSLPSILVLDGLRQRCDGLRISDLEREHLNRSRLANGLQLLQCGLALVGRAASDYDMAFRILKKKVGERFANSAVPW
jgi:hypothetical protein